MLVLRAAGTALKIYGCKYLRPSSQSFYHLSPFSLCVSLTGPSLQHITLFDKVWHHVSRSFIYLSGPNNYRFATVAESTKDTNQFQ